MVECSRGGGFVGAAGNRSHKTIQANGAECGVLVLTRASTDNRIYAAVWVSRYSYAATR